MKKGVIELFLETGNYATKEEKLEFLNEELLKNDPDFIKNLYKDDCFIMIILKGLNSCKICF